MKIRLLTFSAQHICGFDQRGAPNIFGCLKPAVVIFFGMIFWGVSSFVLLIWYRIDTLPAADSVLY